MKILRDFFFGETDPWVLKLVGNLIGAVGVMFLGLTFWLAITNVRSFPESDAGDRLVSGTVMFGSACLAYWLIRTAKRAIDDAGERDGH